jgi:hypothetical protein
LKITPNLVRILLAFTWQYVLQQRLWNKFVCLWSTMLKQFCMLLYAYRSVVKVRALQRWGARRHIIVVFNWNICGEITQTLVIGKNVHSKTRLLELLTILMHQICIWRKLSINSSNWFLSVCIFFFRFGFWCLCSI